MQTGTTIYSAPHNNRQPGINHVRVWCTNKSNMRHHLKSSSHIVYANTQYEVHCRLCQCTPNYFFEQLQAHDGCTHKIDSGCKYSPAGGSNELKFLTNGHRRITRRHVQTTKRQAHNSFALKLSVINNKSLKYNKHETSHEQYLVFA